MFSLETVGLIVFAQGLGYFIKGLVGFGNPLISAPLLSMKLDNAVITPGTLLLDVPINAYIVWKTRNKFRWGKIFPTLVAVMAGVIPGTLLLKMSLPWILKPCLGVLVIGLGVEMSTRSKRTRKPEKPAIRTVVAFISGVCAGLFGINMLIVAYLERTATEYDEFKGSLCALFLVENIFRLCSYWILGLITRDVLFLAAVTIPAAILGATAGVLLSSHMDEAKLRSGAVVMFILGGISILLKSLLFCS